MQQLINLLSFFLLPIILVYGFAIIFGKTKEVNRALGKMFKAIFQFIVDVICSIVTFVFRKLKELHRYCYERWPAVTVVVEVVILVVIIILILS
ncbi:MAG: hypothetical protein ACP5IX_00485 [Patescibacteria group bacterium]